MQAGSKQRSKYIKCRGSGAKMNYTLFNLIIEFLCHRKVNYAMPRDVRVP